MIIPEINVIWPNDLVGSTSSFKYAKSARVIFSFSRRSLYASALFCS